MELVLSVLPFLAFLACPLMMVICLFSMRKPGGTAPSLTETPAAAQLPEERVAALQQQLQTIQAELTALQPVSASPPALAPVNGSDRRVEIDPGVAHAARRPA